LSNFYGSRDRLTGLKDNECALILQGLQLLQNSQADLKDDIEILAARVEKVRVTE
jgi:hypothetical protein